MTPTHALQIVDRVLANCQGTRQDHDTMKQAVAVLAELAAAARPDALENFPPARGPA
jgi:hypothetical protein